MCMKFDDVLLCVTVERSVVDTTDGAHLIPEGNLIERCGVVACFLELDRRNVRDDFSFDLEENEVASGARSQQIVLRTISVGTHP